LGHGADINGGPAGHERPICHFLALGGHKQLERGNELETRAVRTLTRKTTDTLRSAALLYRELLLSALSLIPRRAR